MTGQILGDRYEILREVGNGGMAKVFQAKDRLLNRSVAVKILRPEFADDAEFLNRFSTEAQAAAGLSHPNIVSIYDFGKANGLPYIIMEYVEGNTLKKYIEQNVMLSWQQSVKYAIQICNALECAHKNNIIHRDIKPHNIIMTPDGILKVTDFGIARATSTQTVTLDTDTTMGSVHYFSPEQARGGYTDAKSDIYSLGVVMYEMLTGKVPFEGDSPVAIAVKHIQQQPASPKDYNVSIPLSVEAIVLKAMSKEKAARYANATNMLIDLRAALASPNIVPQKQQNDVTTETIVIPSNEVEQNIRKAAPQRTNPRSNVRTDDRANKRAVVWAVVTSVIIVALLIFGVLAVVNPGIFSTTGTVVIPEVENRDYDEMVAEYEKAGFVLKITQRVSDSDKPENTILTQNPKAGKLIKAPSVNKPFEINVTISAASNDTFTLKNYTRGDAEKTKTELTDLGIIVDLKEEADRSIPKGMIVRTLPVSGSAVGKGDTVTLYISSGPPELTFDMPNLVGESVAQAKRIISQNNLREGELDYEYSDKPKDQIISQNPESGKKVEEYTTVDMVASNGPAPASTPDSDLKTKNITVNIPQNQATTDIKVVADGTTVYSGTHSKDEKTVSVTVSGKERVTVEIYYNGVKASTTVVNL